MAKEDEVRELTELDFVDLLNLALAFGDLGDRLHLPIVFTDAQTIPAVAHGDPMGIRGNLLRGPGQGCL